MVIMPEHNKEVLMKGKKWLRKTTALCAAAVLGAAAVPSAAFGADSYSAA